jgi:tRNA A-37 threonylcarbamoyl transferase component Bud32
MSADDPDDSPTLPHGKQPQPPPEPGEDPTVASPAAGRGKAPDAAPLAPEQLIGKVIGGCRIDKLLGRGAMGAVYKARQIKLDRDVAVKVIRPEMMTDERMLKRFQVEARTVGKFNSAHVVMVHDVGFEQGVHYLVMEFVRGTNLREHVKLLAGGRLPAGEALPLMRQAVSGLEEARRLNVVHRDIKPDNLMLTDQGVLKIADFGIAKPEEDFSMTLTSELVGTPLYMSPEQCQGGASLDFRSDMYSLGATFYYLLTGEPPIRASSVYELIQTKTKLESLCLWKALPELHENHPLSRVIERMTALEADDRYPDYEQLRNDLVLVEHGQTIAAPVKKPRKEPVPALRREKEPAGRGLLWAGLLALGLGGGYAAYHFGTDRAPVITPAGGEDAAEAVRMATERLGGWRRRLAAEGPGESLRQEVGATPVPLAMAGERDRLRVDIDAALSIDRRLAALSPPAELAPPFDDLREHLRRVGEASQLHDAAGPEVRTWLQRRVGDARGEAALIALAKASLLAAYQAWQGDRERAGEDLPRLAALGKRLETVEAARRTMLELLPGTREWLDANLPTKALDEARRRLVPAPVAGNDTDAGPVLDQIQQELDRVGPNDSLKLRAEKLQPLDPASIARRNEVLDAIQRARSVRELAIGTGTSVPTNPGPRFLDEVVDYFRRLDLAFQPLRPNGEALPAWAATLRTELRREDALRQRAVESVRASGAALRSDADAGAPARQIAAAWSAIETMLLRFAESFPGAEPPLAAADLAATKSLVERAAARERLVQEVDALAQDVDKVKTLVQWRGAGEALERRLTAARSAASGGGELAGRLEGVAAACASWRAATARFDEAVAAVADGDLGKAKARIEAASGEPGRAECLALGDCISQVQTVFADLARTLDVVDAAKRLRAIRTATAGLGVRALDAALGRWLDGIAALERRTFGMVAIPGGVVGPSTRVEGFFLSATECSREQFAEFLAELRAAVEGAGSPAARLQSVEARLVGAEMTPDRLQALLEQDSRGSERRPVDRVTWHEAAAYAAWRGQVLPTADEWTLAAFGDGRKYAFPWGAEWSNDPEQRNPSNRELADVDVGGLSWRKADGMRLHHLGGNVAEWLEGAVGEATAPLAGGRYNLRGERDAKEQAGGQFDMRFKADTMSGIGFRTALRLRNVPELAWPR